MLTRAEFSAVVNRITKNNNATADNLFSDVALEHWAYKDILSAVL